MKRNEDAKAYNKIKIKIASYTKVLDAIILYVLARYLSFEIYYFSSNVSSNTLILNGVYISILLLGMYAVHFPLRLYADFVLEHKYKLSNQNMGEWAVDNLKGAFLGFVVSFGLIEIIYVLLAKYPETWWIGAGFIWLFITLGLSRIMPSVIVPLFFKYSEIENQGLKDSIRKLFEKSNVALKDVYAINLSSKSKKANAFVCGLGSSRRVVLSDTLIDNFSIAEIEAVVAHELAHYKHRDILKLTLINSTATFLIFYFIHEILPILRIEPIHNIVFLPYMLIIIMLFSFIAMPMMNTISRIIEKQADQFSLKLTDRPKDFISMITKLGEMNLADFNPSKYQEIMYYNHPPIAKRIQLAESMASENAHA